MSAESGRHVAGTCTGIVLRHVEAKAGAGGVDEVLRRLGGRRTRAELSDDGAWFSYAEFRSLLEASAAVLGDTRCFDDMFDVVSLVEGTMPEATEMLQALGSPMVLYKAVEDANGIMSVISGAGLVHERGTNACDLGYRLLDGFEPFPEFCSFMTGLDGMTPKLFGLAVEEIAETACVFRGDPHCVIHVRWGDPDEQSELELLRMKLSLAESRAEAFRGTVEALVSDEELETVLQRAVGSAARAIRAPGFVLALEPLPWRSQRVFADGMDAAEAARHAAALLAGDELDLPAFVVDVASTKRTYGKLAAVDPFDNLSQVDLPVLRSYGRLAATALDSAMALEDARRQTPSARALLALSRELADVTSTVEMAANVARATPLVVDCDIAAVALIDVDDVARLRGIHGLDRDLERMVLDAEFPVGEDIIRSFRVHGLDDASVDVRAMMVATGCDALATVPVTIDGATVGCLVVAVRHDPDRLVANPELEEQLYGLAAQVSTALRNARLLDQIRHQALHDPLTGLPNRALILDRAEHLLQRARRTSSSVAALYIDLDGFKDVNDTLGHAAGDRLLQGVAARLAAALRESDTIARLGGDEFVVLMEGSTFDVAPELVAQRILDVLREPVSIEGWPMPLRVSASVGIATGDRSSAGELLRDADVALYEAKAAGKNCFVMFAPEMQTAVSDRMAMEMDLRTALEHDEFFLVYQPIFDLGSETVTGAEALLRWQHPTQGVIAPDTFIPVLEESGMIDVVGSWVLQEACRQAAAWHAAGHPIDIAVNVSARQLRSDGLVDDVRRALRTTGLPGTSLTIEITETTIMRNANATVRRLQELRDLGVRIAIDDFGTGYSSLAYLEQFPVSALKIDRSFISTIAESADSGALIHTLVQLGKALGLQTVAEGIEDRHQVERLQREHCDSGQGFLFARPLDPADLEAFMAGDRSLEAARPR